MKDTCNRFRKMYWRKVGSECRKYEKMDIWVLNDGGDGERKFGIIEVI
jgi:hypothetical protein